MKWLFFGILLSSFKASALLLNLGSSVVDLKKDAHGSWISRKCAPECEAGRTLSTIQLPSNLTQLSQGGKNRGSVICNTLPETEVVIARTPQGNEKSLCKFKKDASYVDNASLYKRAILNTPLRK